MVFCGIIFVEIAVCSVGFIKLSTSFVLLKLKQKLQIFKQRKALASTAIVFLCVMLASPFVANAVVYNASDITVTLVTSTPGPNGLQPDNLIRLVKGTLHTTLKTTLTLTGPPAGLVLGTDTLDGGTATTGANNQKTGGMSIDYMGVGVDKLGTGANPGGVTCNTNTITTPGVFTDNTKYLSCNFFAKNAFNKGFTVQANKANDLYLDQSNQIDFTSGHGNDINPNNTTSPQTLIVYPYIQFGVPASYVTLAFVAGGSPVYVQFYDTQAQVDDAIRNNTRPAGVPAYSPSGVTSSGQTSSTGSGLIGILNSILATLLSIFTEFLYFLFYWLIAPIIQAMLSIHTYSDTFVNVIYPGWEVVRNVCNIFFIIGLITIAIATLFRLEGYQFRHLLVQLIIAALLVNFSLVIAQAILGLADTIQSQFLPNNVEVIRSLARDLMVSNIRNVAFSGDFASFGQFSSTVSLLFYVSMSIASFGVFSAIAVFLVVRIVALWIYLMVSPIAYVAGVIPSTAPYRGKWWGEFLKYAFFTPIMAFFLNMTAVISSTMNPQSGVLSVISAQSFKDSTAPNLTVFVFKVASNILLLVFLIAALKVSESFSIYGASAVNEIAQKGMWAPFKVGAAPFVAAGNLAKTGVDAGVNKLQRLKMEKTSKWVDPADESRMSWRKAAFFALNPSALKNAVKERGEERMHVAEHAAQASASVGVQRFWGEATMDERTEATLHGAQEQKKKFASLSGERANLDNLAELKKNLNEKKDGTYDPEEIDKQRYLGQMLKLVEEKGLNEVLKQANRFGSSKKDGYSASREGLSAFLNEMKDKGILTEGEAGHLLTEISDISYKNKEYWYAENFNTQHGHPAMFKMEKDASTGEYIETVAGRTEYDSLVADVNTKLNSTGKAVVDAELLAMATPLPPDEEEAYRGRRMSQLKTQYKNEEAEDLKTSDEDKYKLFQNYDTYEQSKLEVATNYKKAASQQDARDGHYTRFNRARNDGFTEFNDLGINFIASFDSTRAKQATEWNPQTTAASSKSYYNHMAQNIGDVKEQVINLEQKGKAYAGAKAVLRMNAFKNFFLIKRIDNDGDKKKMLDDIDVISKEVEAASIAAGGAPLPTAEIEAIFTAATVTNKIAWEKAVPAAEMPELINQIANNAV